MGRWLSNVPVLGGLERGAGTAATGAVDTFVADPGNAILGVNAENMGLFEENAAGAKTVSLLTLGLGGEGGLLTDVLMPGQGAPGEAGGGAAGGGQQQNDDGGGGLLSSPILLLAAAAAAVAVLVGVLD